MQEDYFVIPNVKGLKAGLEEVEKIVNTLNTERYAIDSDYVVARSLATCAYIILREAYEICAGSEEIPNMPKFEKPE
jgi:hypothetical protein